MRRHLLPVIALAFASVAFPGPGRAAEFSLYGVKMGTPKAELEQYWTRKGADEYAIPDSAVFNIKPTFDHRDRLYTLTFSVSIGESYPSDLMATAFQRLVQDMWGGDRDNTLTTRAARGVVDVSVKSRRLEEEWINHIKVQLSPLLRP